MLRKGSDPGISPHQLCQAYLVLFVPPRNRKISQVVGKLHPLGRCSPEYHHLTSHSSHVSLSKSFAISDAFKTFISRGLTIGWLPTGFVPISGQQRRGGPGSSALGLRGALRLGRGRGLPRGRRVGPAVHGGRGTGAAVHGLSADPSEGDVPGTGGLGAWGSWGVGYWSVEVRIGMPAMSWGFRFSFTGIHRG